MASAGYNAGPHRVFKWQKSTVEIQSCGSMQFQSMKQGDMLGELYFIH